MVDIRYQFHCVICPFSIHFISAKVIINASAMILTQVERVGGFLPRLTDFIKLIHSNVKILFKDQGNLFYLSVIGSTHS